jgi:alpha-glucosidase
VATRESPDDDTFLLGDSLLVAPVAEEGATSREVPVPAGLWYDFWTDQPLRGPARVRLDAPLGRIPVLVRAGAVVPREDPASSTGARGTERLSLHLYPPEVGASGAGLLYTDRGDGYGPCRLDRFLVTRRQGEVELRWVESERGLPWPYRRTEVTLHGVRDARGSRAVEPSSVWVGPVEDL